MKEEFRMSKMKKVGTPVKATVVGNKMTKGEVQPNTPAVQPNTPAPVQPEVQPNAPAPVESALDPHDASLAQLGQERIVNANLHLQNRQKELEGLLMQIKTKYEENGKYRLTAIDIPRGVVTRSLVG